MRSFEVQQRSQWIVAGAKRGEVSHSIGRCIEQVRFGEDRYERWRTCLETLSLKPRKLALGSLKVPAQGWATFRGRRGHQSFCDELRAYDLATGSAYIAAVCSSQSLLPAGAVSRTQTGGARPLSTVAAAFAGGAKRGLRSGQPTPSASTIGGLLPVGYRFASV
jgi:hypothetical protein